MKYPPEPYDRYGKMRWQFFAWFLVPAFSLWFGALFAASYFFGVAGFICFILLSFCVNDADDWP